MTRVPRVTSDVTLRKLLRAGFRIVRITGSHVRLRASDGRATTVPRHSRGTLKLKTLAVILQHAGLTVEQFNEL